MPAECTAPLPLVVAQSEAMQDVLQTARRVAAGSAKVLIAGESGVGKDVIARFIHAHSPRAARPFIALNCAGLSDTLLESELFGHVRGSFTGAHRDKIGKLQLANGGTVFLDEVGEMTTRMQSMLLRFLESGEIQPVGADSPAMRVDARVIAATNRDLRQMVESGAFREDLLYRIDVVHIHIPPLRERREDLRALIQHLMARVCPSTTLSAPALEILERYNWPGNIRELQNVIEQIGLVAAGAPIGIDDLPSTIVAAVKGHVRSQRERRRHATDDLFEGLVSGRYTFWDNIYPQFIDRDLTRSDIRQLIRRALAETQGNYRMLVRLFRMPRSDYKRFMNFLAAHDCTVDFREFRPSYAPSMQGTPLRREEAGAQRAHDVHRNPPRPARRGLDRGSGLASRGARHPATETTHAATRRDGPRLFCSARCCRDRIGG